uniref:Tenascin XB n=1 Tax=Xiphophorus couchianus TaxID=32473 RepID=A0A3B5MMS8_9TELE
MWDSPEGKYKDFLISRTEVDKDESRKQKENEQDKDRDTKEFSTENGGDEDNNKVPKDFQVPITQKGGVDKPTEREKSFRQVLPGSARSHQFEHLPSQTEYTITLLGKGPGILSRLHKLVISTGTNNGPEPPSNIMFSEVTEDSMTVSWTKPKSSVDGFKVTYTHADEGEPVSVMVGSRDSTLDLSQLSPGSSYEVTIVSTLGLDESDPIKDTVMTLPDPPTDLQAVNVTDSTALLLWRPTLASVDKYTIVYGSGTGTLKFPFPTDCSQELLNGVVSSNVVEIFPQGKLGKSMNIFCDMETDGGGWMVFQRRKDGSVEFYNGWKDYVSGFGDLSGEFWLGLEKIHNLTKMTKMNLRVDLRDGSEQVFAKYSTFEVSTRNYKLSVGGYSGTAGDSLSYHNNCVFSTKDRDPAPWITRCAISYQGGWWYKNCHQANLNGRYGIDYKHQGVIWKSWKGEHHSIQFTEMKMRPASFRPPASRTK